MTKQTATPTHNNSYLYQGNTIVVFLDGNPHTITSSHLNFTAVVEAVKAGDWDRAKEVIDPAKSLENYAQGNVTITGDVLRYRGKEIHNVLTSQVIRMYKEGFDLSPFIAFMDNLMENPSRTAVNELYDFMEKGKMPITPDGHLLAYKKVKEDYTDIYSGAFDNSVGQVLEMPRNEVDDVRDNHCSNGFHFCSHEYLPNFGVSPGVKVMVVKINPRDIVSIPSDYSFTKGRTCRYEVIDEIDSSVDVGTESFTKAVQETANFVIGSDGRARDAKGRYCKAV